MVGQISWFEDGMAFHEGFARNLRDGLRIGGENEGRGRIL